MMFRRSYFIEANPQFVFDALTDIPAIPEWISVVRAARITSELPLGVGSEFTQDAVIAYQRFSIDGVVREYERPHRFAYLYATGIVAGRWYYSLLPSGGGCVLEIKIDFNVSPILRPFVERVVRGNLDTFAEWVGSGRRFSYAVKR